MNPSRLSGAPAVSAPTFGTASFEARVLVATTAIAALVLPFVLYAHTIHNTVHRQWLTAVVLIAFSIVNVEIGRVLTGRGDDGPPAHKALAGWACASALLLPAPWLLLIVPVTCAHSQWRARRDPVWRCLQTASFLVLSAMAAGTVAHAVFGGSSHWTRGDGDRGLLAVMAAVVAFLLVESELLSSMRRLQPAPAEPAEDAATTAPRSPLLPDASFYLTELGLLLLAALLAVVWVAGAWFVLLFLPIYILAQRAVLYQPMLERADAAARLSSANEHLERANAFQTDLIGMLGHELGNPLTSVTGYSQMATEELDVEDYAGAKRSLYVVERNAARMRTVLYEILTHAASEKAALVAHPEVCQLAPRLSAAAAGFPRDLRPEVDCHPGLTGWVQPSHLDQMLANLVSNAQKYAGAVRLSAREVDGYVHICVTDDGPGVPERFRERLFERYTRDSDLANRAPGTGLGLSITRQLARANGGDVTYHATMEPTGSVFTLILRQTEADAAVEFAEAADVVGGHT